MEPHNDATSEIQKLQDLVKILRAPDGCPWDQEQTMKTLTPHILEEAQELVEAIHSGDINHIKEELGDVLLHVTMLSEIASEDKNFTLSDVAKGVREKMIRRHPHVFGDKKFTTKEEVIASWEAIKAQEKKLNLHLPLNL